MFLLKKFIDFKNTVVHQNDTFDNVIFSDESTFEIGNTPHKVFVLKGEKTPEKKIPQIKSKLMVWGAISKKGIVNLKFVDGTEDKYKYLEILQKNLIEKANLLYGINGWRFQQDNAPVHNSYLIKEWLSENVPHVLNHPPQSPDLNPIENIWGIMKTRIEKNNPKNLPELKLEVAAAWESLSTEIISNCIDHLHKTIMDVKAKNGGFSK